MFEAYDPNGPKTRSNDPILSIYSDGNSRLNVAAEHEDAGRGREETYHRSFRMLEGIEEDDIITTYRNGVLEVTLDDRGRDHPWPVHRNRGLTVASARRSASDSPTSPSLVPGHRSVGAL